MARNGYVRTGKGALCTFYGLIANGRQIPDNLSLVEVARVYNHPSGGLQPSRADVELTQKIK
jgi:hypothetical protein